MPGPLELGLIFLVVLLVFGANRIPEIARGIGKGIREFKDATGDIKRELESEGHRQRGPNPQPPSHGAPRPRNEAGDAQHEPPRQESGRPASAEDGPPEPASAANPGEESKSA